MGRPVTDQTYLTGASSKSRRTDATFDLPGQNEKATPAASIETPLPKKEYTNVAPTLWEKLYFTPPPNKSDVSAAESLSESFEVPEVVVVVAVALAQA